MINVELKITISGFYNSLFTICGAGLTFFRAMFYDLRFTIYEIDLSVLRPMHHAPCSMHYDSRFTIHDSRSFSDSLFTIHYSRFSPPGGII
jgi:hypothetical protein